MSENPFETVLTKELGGEDAPPASLAILREFCEGIERSTERRVLCYLRPGFNVIYGQEWKPMLKPRGQEVEQILFRAYVPLGGWPVTLDLHEAALTTCDGPDDLRRELTAFLREPSVLEQIRYFRLMSAQA